MHASSGTIVQICIIDLGKEAKMGRVKIQSTRQKQMRYTIMLAGEIMLTCFHTNAQATPFSLPGRGEPDGVGFFKVSGKG